MRNMMKKMVLFCLFACLCTVNVCAAKSVTNDFSANFNRTVIYDLEGLVRAFDGLAGNGLGDLNSAEERDFSPANCTVNIGDDEVKAFCYQQPDSSNFRLQFVGARVEKNSYQVAGLRLGDNFSEKQAAVFDSNMKAMGWTPKGDAIPRAYRWEKMLGDRSLEFCVRVQNNKIVDILWLQYLKTGEHACN